MEKGSRELGEFRRRRKIKQINKTKRKSVDDLVCNRELSQPRGPRDREEEDERHRRGHG